MKLKTSSCKAVIRKDITRFAPAWGLYSAFLLLITYLMFQDLDEPWHNARQLVDISPIFVMVSFGYAMLAAQLLFGYLCDSRSCNSIHAFPLRREAWFLSHVAAGLLFYLVPTGTFALIQSLFCGEYIYVPFLWFALQSLQYLFFFGLAVFCMFLTGNRFASGMIYLGFNFLAVAALWVYNALLIPLMYGVQGNAEVFFLFCPVYMLTDSVLPIQFVHNAVREVCLEGPSWVYFGVLAGLGLVFLGLSVLLYRRRSLECAGDFVAEKWEKPVFLTVYSLCAGTLLAAFMNLMYSTQNILGSVVWILIGLAVGVITGRMLLQRTPRVFNKGTWRYYGALSLTVVLVMVLFAADAFGMRRYVPKAEDVESVTVEARGDGVLLTEPEDIQRVLELHSHIVRNYGTEPRYGYSYFEVYYKLKDGSTLSRRYRLVSGVDQTDPDLWKLLSRVCQDRDFLFGTRKGPLWEQKLLGGSLNRYESKDSWSLDRMQALELLTAMMQDANEGNLLPQVLRMYDDEYKEVASVQIDFDYGGEFNGYFYLTIPKTAKHTLAYMAKLFNPVGN